MQHCIASTRKNNTENMLGDYEHKLTVIIDLGSVDVLDIVVIKVITDLL